MDWLHCAKSRHESLLCQMAEITFRVGLRSQKLKRGLASVSKGRMQTFEGETITEGTIPELILL